MSVSVDDDGAIVAYVKNESGKVLAASKAGMDEYRRNGLHQDIQKHAKQPRVRGRIG